MGARVRVSHVERRTNNPSCRAQARAISLQWFEGDGSSLFRTIVALALALRAQGWEAGARS